MPINFHQVKYFIKHFFVAKRNGHGIHSPFAYQLCEEVFYNTNSFYVFKQLAALRNALLTNETDLEIEDFGAGSKTFKTNKRKIKEIAGKGISTQKQSETLYKLLNFLKSKTILELGTSLGLTTLYLSQVNKESRVITVEGSKELYDFASQQAKKLKVKNITFIHSVFDAALPKTLVAFDSLDFFYVDGNHTYEATVSYFKQALAKKSNDSVFIFDDIYWSPAMTKAWQEIKNDPAVTLSIDTFSFGMVFFRQEIKEKVDLRFYL